MKKNIVLLILVSLILIVSCEEIPSEKTEEIEECTSAEDCDKCGNDCIPLSVAVVSDCLEPTEDFNCMCDNGKCKKVGKDVECTTDDDCITGGCSGTICQSKDAEPIFTTCEYLPEYACYKEINCACIDGKCEWSKTEEFDKCIEEARKSKVEVIV